MADFNKRSRSDSQWEAPATVHHNKLKYHRQDLIVGDSSAKASPWWAYGEMYCFMTAKNTIASWMCKAEGCHQFLIVD